MSNNFYDQVYSLIQSTSELGVCHITADSVGTLSNIAHIKGKEYKNFSLCDYLALSQDARLKEAAIKAIEQNGVYTPVSKTYIKLKIYEDSENYLGQLFNKPAVIFPRTTLAHIGVLPVITYAQDAILIDHQAHTSMRIATSILQASGYYIETVRHNRIDLLEEKILELKTKYSKIWYLSDSVYSMYGDTLDYEGLDRLLDTYEQFHLYVDDAHGMSWDGENGSGFLLNKLKYRQNMVLITSLGKGFGAGGGAAICYDEKIRDRIVKASLPLIFTLPVSPANLGAIIASAKIHLTNEIYSKQAELKEKINLFYSLANELKIPLINDPNTPVVFVATGKPDMCRDISINIMKRGFFVNISHYPVVPLNNSGIRIVLSNHNSLEDIKELIYVLKDEYDKALNKRNLDVSDILKHYKIQKQETEI
jgi:7-keto-8-aminopelargonate synthetase-like enzyme